MKQKYLLIVESSSKCGAIEKYLGPEYKCIASNGHIRILADGLKSIDTKNNYEPHFTIDPEKKTHVQKMAATVANFDKSNVIIATDHDREGEAIGWHICQVFDLPVCTTRRIVFHEITKKALIESVQNPKTLDINMVYAAIARQVLDVLVGYKISPLLWKYVAQGSGLSAGRCQTPALRLVYENANQINNLDIIEHRIQGCFFPPHNIMLTLDATLNEPEIVEFMQMSATYKHTFELGAKRISERSPPKPLNTSAILQLASSNLHMGAKQTMALCQTLYQLGHITYMRTDNRTYSPEFIDSARKYIADNWSDRHVNPVMPVNTDAGCPHEAIRVTNIALKDLIIVDSKGIEKLYKLIWTHTVQSCMAPASYTVMPITVSAPLNKCYKSNIEVPIFMGYKALDKTSDANSNTINSLILKMQTTMNKEATYTYLQSVPYIENKCKPHYTEAGLINKLEDLGIGRPSTYSTIIDTILTRKYVEKADVPGSTVPCNIYTLRQYETGPSVESVEKTFGSEKGKLLLEPVGKLVIEFLLEKFDALFSYDFTRTMEESLDQVASGTKPWFKVCDECNQQIKQLVNDIKKLEKKVYKVNADWTLMFTKDNAVLRNIHTNEFKSVKYGLKLDINKLENGEYTYEDLVQIEQRDLGNNVIVKSGKFGLYAEIDGNNVSLSHLRKPIEQVVLSDIPAVVAGKNVLRVLTPALSIRNGKYGPYIYYQTEKMKKPKFYDLKGFEQGFGVCDPDELVAWIRSKYGV